MVTESGQWQSAARQLRELAKHFDLRAKEQEVEWSSENLTERPEDTVRRFASILGALERMVDAEIKRLEANDLSPPRWWEIRRKAWTHGVETARAVSQSKMWPMKSAFYQDHREA